jgi:hypothetical protein
MGHREVRRVPPGWEHPKDERDRFQPMYDEPFVPVMQEWIAEFQAALRDGAADYNGDRISMETWLDDSPPPDPKYYRPDWPEESRTMLMMYECTSEGTPISPAFETPEALARWLTDTGASAFASLTMTYEQWLAVCLGGYCPPVVMSPDRPELHLLHPE